MDPSLQQAVQAMQPQNTMQQPSNTLSQALASITQKKKQQQDDSYSYQYALKQALSNLSQKNVSDASANLNSGEPGQGANNADWAGLCQAYAEHQTYGKTGIYPTAAAAFNAYAENGQTVSEKDAKPGDLVYFQPDASNGGAGHVGIYQGSGKMQSATYEGVQTDNIAAWQKATGQKISGFVKPT